MPQGDKYIHFTNYLKRCHAQGQNKITLSFTEIEHIWGFPLSKSMRKYSWGNARALSYSLGWLRAGFTVTSCNLPAETVTFAYTPEKVSALLSGQYSRGQGKSAPAAKLPSNILAMPSASEVEKYLCAWDNVETYRLQESALNKLFFELAPRNDNIENILIKAATLNNFYSTNIFSIYPVAQHILSLDVDRRLRDHDLSLVSDISHVIFPSGKAKTLYSFATKYCSHHKPDVYPIYDDYISKVLRYYRDVDGFSKFTNEMLSDYLSFNTILHDFQLFYKLEKYTLKEIDQYLWQLGKTNFPKKYYRRVNDKRKGRHIDYA